VKERIVMAMLAAVLLTGCGEKRVDGPTAPQEISTAATIPQTTEMSAPQQAIPETTMPKATVPETQPEMETMEVTAEGITLQALEPLIEPKDGDFVSVKEYLPSVQVDLRYAGPDNFTGCTIYNFEDAYLRYGTVKKLEAVCGELEQQGLCLKIWDAFRPHQAQHALWEVCPDSNYVANPERGYSAHTRGNAVDLTIVDAEGREVEMPTGFDDFSSAADRDYSDCTEEAKENAVLLQTVMEKHGFRGYWGEWWHYTDRDQYDPEQVFDPGEFSLWTPDCEEYITLRSKPDAKSDAVNRIAVGERFMVLGYTGKFALAQYQGQRGYVLCKYIQPVQ